MSGSVRSSPPSILTYVSLCPPKDTDGLRSTPDRSRPSRPDPSTSLDTRTGTSTLSESPGPLVPRTEYKDVCEDSYVQTLTDLLSIETLVCLSLRSGPWFNIDTLESTQGIDETWKLRTRYFTPIPRGGVPP